MSYVAKKRLQIDNLNELQKEKRPPDTILWWGTAEDLEEWLDKVLGTKKEVQDENLEFMIRQEDIE
jgi:hypothetical protein